MTTPTPKQVPTEWTVHDEDEDETVFYSRVWERLLSKGGRSIYAATPRRSDEEGDIER